MSKPQFAAEPSMEDILSSIRRMISDDKPGPNPIPDQMGRTPFGGSSPAAPAAGDGSRGLVSPLAPAPSFSSLSDALKAATGTSERRNLQQEIAEVLEKGPPRGRRPELSTFAPSARNATPERSESNPAGPAMSPHMLPGGGNSPAAETGSDFQPFDFGTHVPQRDASAKAPRADQNDQPTSVARPTTAPSGDLSPAFEAQQAGQQRIELPKSDGQRIVAMPSRGSGLNGATVAPFPRAVRDGVKPSAPAADPDEKGDRQPVAAAHDGGSLAGSSGETNTAQPASEEPRAKPEASASQTAASEALLDAMVDMVHKQPDTLSVFTSGASFISGVSAKTTSADNLAATMSGKSGAPKMDKAAAELLRPMLRQWLSDNMPRIVEEALRSELMDSSKDPGKG